MKPADSLAKGLGGLFVLVILFFGLKSCVVSAWVSADRPNSYALIGDGGRSLRLIFLPRNEAMIWYVDPPNDFIEGVLAKVRGTYGTHYFWRLWRVDDSTGLFGFRVYPPDTEPVRMEITVLERFMQGRGDPTFPKVGETKHQVILFARDAVRFQDIWLQKQPDNPPLIAGLLSKLQRETSKEK